MRVPTRSDGMRSGVNWMRAKLPRTVAASVSAASVFASPGTPSSRQWPRASRHTRRRSTIRSWPTMTFLTSNRVRSRRAEASSTSATWRAGLMEELYVDVDRPDSAALPAARPLASGVRRTPNAELRTGADRERSGPREVRSDAMADRPRRVDLDPAAYDDQWTRLA